MENLGKNSTQKHAFHNSLLDEEIEVFPLLTCLISPAIYSPYRSLGLHTLIRVEKNIDEENSQSNEYFKITHFSAKKTIMERVDGYMKRAEDLKNVLEGLNSQAKGGN